MAVTLISKYFPELESDKLIKLEALVELYTEWNQKINVVSRKDIDNIIERHILHSLLIAKFIEFKPDSQILDLGTGGGFPGIPLAIMYPESSFHLVDARAKKITVVKAVAKSLGLTNVKAEHGRVEELTQQYDFVVTRAVAKTAVLTSWCGKLISDKHRHGLPNGLIALKGGNLSEELNELRKDDYYDITPASTYFSEPFFEEKCIVYVQG